ncbi:MAG: hypothetical protein KTR31_12430 [Myxococcales bacterium]|nr:hypothetical protein [Myxococcales bacterium]
MGLVWMVLMACRPDPPTGVAIDVDAKPPAGWRWFSDTERGFEVLVPEVPRRGPSRETLDVDGSPTTVNMHRTEFSGRSTFIVLTSELPGGAVSSGKAKQITESLVRSRSVPLGTLSEVTSWGSAGMAAGVHGKIDTGRIGGAAVSAGLVGDDVWILQGVVDRGGVLERFFDSFSKTDPAPMQLALADVQVPCPTRCTELDDVIRSPYGKVDVKGVHGLVDDASFRVVAMPIEGGDPVEMVEFLKTRGVEDARGRIISEEGPPTQARLQLRTGDALTWLSLYHIADTLFSVSVSDSNGDDPPWREAFEGAFRSTPATPPPSGE